MNYKADELEDAGGDEALIGTYERNAQTLSMAAKQYKKSLTSLNSASSRASRNRTVRQVVKTAQIQWGTCRQLQDEVEAAAKTAENHQAQVDRKEAGTGSGALHGDGSAAGSENLLSAQTALQSTTDQANKALRQFAILLERAELLLRWGNSSRIGNGTGFYECGCGPRGSCRCKFQCQISQTILRNRRCGAQAAPPADRGSRERRKRLSG